jgi:hypothetical protein
MAVNWSVTVRNAVLNAWETAIGTSAIVRIYTGSKPASTSAATTGDMLVQYTLGSDWAAAASSGAKAFNALPIVGTGADDGVAGYYRIFASDGTTCHEQGTVTATGGGGDMTISNTSIATGQTVNITGFTLTAPRA